VKGFLSPKNLSLASVGVLLFLVSVPRVHRLAVQDNQRDAQSAVRALYQAVSTASAVATPQELAAGLEERLRDVKLHEEHGLIQRHGYLFEVAPGSGLGDVVRAWPVSHGDTGAAAYLMDPDGTLRVHANPAALWSGPLSSRPTGQEPGWQLAERPL